MAATKTAKISSSSSLPFLPSELILEVFSRLPSKSLLRFRSIFDDDFQKSLNTYEFQHKHAFNVLNQPSNERLLVTFPPLWKEDVICEIDPYPCTLISSSNSSPSITQSYQSKQIFKDILPYKMTPAYNYRVIGASNGLICFYYGFHINVGSRRGIRGRSVTQYRTDHYLVLWNPCTEECHSLPIPQGFNFNLCYASCDAPITKCGFGYDNTNKTFKLVMVEGYVTQFYDLSTNLWKVNDTISINWRYFDDEVESSESTTMIFGQYLNGSLHWIVSSTNIVAIDLSNEVSSLINLPPCCSNEHCLNLGVLKGCLSISCYWSEGLKLNIWVRKDYGRGDSWSNIATIKLDPSEMRFEPSEMIYRPPLCISRDEKMLFLVRGVVAYLLPTDQKFHYFDAYFDEGIVHVDTLVSPKPGVYGSSKDDNHSKALVPE